MAGLGKSLASLAPESKPKRKTKHWIFRILLTPQAKLPAWLTAEDTVQEASIKWGKQTYRCLLIDALHISYSERIVRIEGDGRVLVSPAGWADPPAIFESDDYLVVTEPFASQVIATSRHFCWHCRENSGESTEVVLDGDDLETTYKCQTCSHVWYDLQVA